MLMFTGNLECKFETTSMKFSLNLKLIGLFQCGNYWPIKRTQCDDRRKSQNKAVLSILPTIQTEFFTSEFNLNSHTFSAIIA